MDVQISDELIRKFADTCGISHEVAYNALEWFPKGKLCTSKEGRFRFLYKVAHWYARQKIKDYRKEYNRQYYIAKKRYVKKKDREPNDDVKSN